MSIGYTARIVTSNKAANGRKLGVKLGRICIKYDISVIEVAAKFNVSRQAVYNWFIGVSDPKGDSREGIENYIRKLKHIYI